MIVFKPYLNVEAQFEGKKPSQAPDAFFILQQVHGDKICFLNSIEEARSERNSQGDAIISTVPHLKIAVKTADCVPILIAHPELVAAIHAGWRGTKMAILQSCIQKIKEEYSISVSELKLAIGPSICANCYEVGEEVAREFNESYLTPKDHGKFLLNLQKANFDLALQEGVRPEQIHWVQECTLCRPEQYYSYRYETQRNLPKEGRNYSWITLLA